MLLVEVVQTSRKEVDDALSKIGEQYVVLDPLVARLVSKVPGIALSDRLDIGLVHAFAVLFGLLGDLRETGQGTRGAINSEGVELLERHVLDELKGSHIGERVRPSIGITHPFLVADLVTVVGASDDFMCIPEISEQGGRGGVLHPPSVLSDTQVAA